MTPAHNLQCDLHVLTREQDLNQATSSAPDNRHHGHQRQHASYKPTLSCPLQNGLRPYNTEQLLLQLIESVQSMTQMMLQMQALHRILIHSLKDKDNTREDYNKLECNHTCNWPIATMMPPLCDNTEGNTNSTDDNSGDTSSTTSSLSSQNQSDVASDYHADRASLLLNRN